MKIITPIRDKSEVITISLGPDEMKLEKELDELYKQVDACDEVGHSPPFSIIKRIVEIERIIGL